MKAEKDLKTSVVIIGGGIGGLTMALALKKAGIKATVFEQTERLGAAGAGLLLASNAVKGLTRLGLGQAIKDLSVPQLKAGIYSNRGEFLGETSGEELEKRFGAITLAVHRADLQEMLLKAVGRENVKLGHQLKEFEQDAVGVMVKFENGQEARAGLLIGADGLHSRVREQLFGKTQPRYSGYTAWRGIVGFEHSQLLPGEFWGCGARFGIAPLSAGRVYWFACKNAPEGERDKPGERKQELLDIFGQWTKPIPALLAATEAGAILRNDIYDRVPLKKWSVGRVTLLGDAAHPMTPNLGQGACQAIEDAVVLGECLQKPGGVAMALHEYEERRIARTGAIVQRSWQIGRVGQWANPLACWIRNKGVKLMPSDLQLKQLEPILGYEF